MMPKRSASFRPFPFPTRRDEMWVTKRDISGNSNLLSFSEYEDVRYDKDIRKSCLQGRLGGIPGILTGGAMDDALWGEEENFNGLSASDAIVNWLPSPWKAPRQSLNTKILTGKIPRRLRRGIFQSIMVSGKVFKRYKIGQIGKLSLTYSSFPK